MPALNAPRNLNRDSQMQLGLFDNVSPGLRDDEAVSKPLARAAVRQVKRRAPVRIEIATITQQDMPDYPGDLVHQIEEEIAAIPTDRVLLTYREIWGYFGVSRATVARRMKEGLVPGIRMSEGRVLDDGPVRRLNRVQIRWLLLAVRRCRSISGPRLTSFWLSSNGSA